MSLEILIDVNDLNAKLEDYSDEERKQLFEAFMSGYCKECGGEHLPCYCMKDE